MGRYTGPKNRLSRREGYDIFGKGPKLRKAEIKPGGLNKGRAGKISEYGIQLRAKQKAKRVYGIVERQFSNYIKTASKSRGKVGDALVSLLERRLDNVVYRLGWAKTRPAARQMVSHGHVLVNQQKLNIPSHILSINDEVELKSNFQGNVHVEESLQEKREMGDWLVKNGFKGKILREPSILDLKEPISISEIIEFYSR